MGETAAGASGRARRAGIARRAMETLEQFDPRPCPPGALEENVSAPLVVLLEKLRDRLTPECRDDDDVDQAVLFLDEAIRAHNNEERLDLTLDAIGALWDAVVNNGGMTEEEQMKSLQAEEEFHRALGLPRTDEVFPKIHGYKRR